MAAHRRRTAFAAPFVITVAASCASKPTSPPPPQVRTWTVRMVNMKCVAVENTKGNPPPPQSVACPPGMASEVVATIEQQLGKPYCTSRSNIVACPLEPGEELKQPLNVVWMVEKDGANCHAEEISNCPKGADCNPPKPRYFPCPPEVTEDHPLMIAEMPDATCVRVPPNCEDTGCARDKIDCLPDSMKSPSK